MEYTLGVSDNNKIFQMGQGTAKILIFELWPIIGSFVYTVLLSVE